MPRRMLVRPVASQTRMPDAGVVGAAPASPIAASWPGGRPCPTLTDVPSGSVISISPRGTARSAPFAKADEAWLLGPCHSSARRSSAPAKTPPSRPLSAAPHLAPPSWPLQTATDLMSTRDFRDPRSRVAPSGPRSGASPPGSNTAATQPRQVMISIPAACPDLSGAHTSELLDRKPGEPARRHWPDRDVASQFIRQVVLLRWWHRRRARCVRPLI